jgi:hypothetical protein
VVATSLGQYRLVVHVDAVRLLCSRCAGPTRGVRCWFAPHDIQGGRKIHEQIGAAIRVYDKLLLILSDASMNNSWVKTEIANRPRPRGTAETPDALPDHAGAVRPDQGVEAV